MAGNEGRWVGHELEEASARAVFESLDTDGNGWLSKTELGEGMRALGIPVSGKGLDDLFAAVDTDENERISFGEFLVFARIRNDALAAVFERLDADDSDSLSPREIRAGLATLGIQATDAQIADLVSRMDRYGSLSSSSWSSSSLSS